ncbi:MAG TPA: hypothetical protein VF648_06745 [Pyrinomonadaceae bacterium]|jgi:hypothetical protein
MKVILVLSAVLWLIIVGSGLHYVYSYENKPAPGKTSPPRSFPVDGGIVLDNRQPNLFFFAHPQCPCTRAGINELARLMTMIQGRVSARVIFFKPADAEQKWAETDSWKNAAAIPGVQVSVDEDGRETKRFNAETSGTTLLYDANGQLRFHGGITASRGHEGDNAGRSAIAEIVTRDLGITVETSAFGCSLFDNKTLQKVIEGTN